MKSGCSPRIESVILKYLVTARQYAVLSVVYKETGYAAYINRNLEIVSAANQEANEGLQELIDKNYDHLKEILDYAAEMWELP